MQVWEINLNPHVVYKAQERDPYSQANDQFYKEYIKALAEIDLPSQATFRPRINYRPKSFFKRLLKRIGKL